MARSSQRNGYSRRKKKIGQLWLTATPAARSVIEDFQDDGHEVDIRQIPRSGKNGNITVTDVRKYIADQTDNNQ